MIKNTTAREIKSPKLIFQNTVRIWLNYHSSKIQQILRTNKIYPWCDYLLDDQFMTINIVIVLKCCISQSLFIKIVQLVLFHQMRGDVERMNLWSKIRKKLAFDVETYDPKCCLIQISNSRLSDLQKRAATIPVTTSSVFTGGKQRYISLGSDKNNRELETSVKHFDCHNYRSDCQKMKKSD